MSRIFFGDVRNPSHRAWGKADGWGFRRPIRLWFSECVAVRLEDPVNTQGRRCRRRIGDLGLLGWGGRRVGWCAEAIGELCSNVVFDIGTPVIGCDFDGFGVGGSPLGVVVDLTGGRVAVRVRDAEASTDGVMPCGEVGVGVPSVVHQIPHLSLK